MTRNEILAMLSGVNGGTHMPYVVPGGPFLFCLATATGAWRVHSWHGAGAPTPIGPDPPAGGVQCAPVGIMESGRLRWSFVGTYPGAFAVHADAGEPRVTSGAGFSIPGGEAYTRKFLVRGPAGVRLTTHLFADGIAYRMAGGRQVLAVVPAAEGIVLTTYRPDERARCLVVQSGKAPREIRLPDGSAPYKPCFAFGGVFHAKQTGPGWENRKIEWADSFTESPVPESDWFEVLPSMPGLVNARRGGVRGVL